MSAAPAHAHQEVHHELSPWPLVVGLGAAILLLGVAFIRVSYFAPIPGLVIFLVGIYGWVSEDVNKFPSRERTWKGLHIGQWGMLGFLATEVSTFGALFAVFFAKRAEADVWPQAGVHLPVAVAAINTAILIASGFVLHWGEHRLKKHNSRKGLIYGLLGASLLGIIFLGFQVQEYVELISHGLTLSSSGYGSIFYLLTGTHGFHVLLGVIMLLAMAVRAMLGNFDAERHVAVTAVAYYWHFVDIVWIFLFLVVYLGVI